MAEKSSLCFLCLIAIITMLYSTKLSLAAPVAQSQDCQNRCAAVYEGQCKGMADNEKQFLNCLRGRNDCIKKCLKGSLEKSIKVILRKGKHGGVMQITL